MNGKKKKTVEEILKEEGVIKEPPREEEEPVIKVEEKIDLRNVVMNVEKLAAEVKALREVKFQADERIRELAEKIGELRSLIFQRESLVKEIESKVRLLDEMVSDIRPQKIKKEMEKRREEIEKLELKIEKLEAMNKDIIKNLNKVRNIVENIKSVENLQKMLEKIEDMVSKGKETKAEMDRLAGKAERFYVEIENRLKEFKKFKAKVESLDELTKEIMKTVDEINIKISGLSSKEDVEDFKKKVDELISSNKKKIDERIKSIEDVLRIPPADIVAKTKSLENKKEKILKLLNNVEEQYRKALITQKAYEEIKEKNKAVLNKIEKELKKLKAKEKPLLKDIPSIVENLGISVKTTEAKVIDLEKRIEEQSEMIKTLMDRIQKLVEEFNEFREGELSAPLKAQVEMTRGILEKFRGLNEKLSELEKNLSSQEYRIKFFEILNILTRTQKPEEISSLISQLDKIIIEMKENNVWNKGMEELVESLLSEIGENWRRYGYEEVARIFDSEVEKLKTEIHKYMLTY